jgi:hypothetical protein
MTTRLIGALTAAVLVLAVGGCASDDATTASPSSPASAAASADGEVVRMWIEPELADCVGVGPMECLQVSYTEGGEPELFYSAIDGFEFVEGTSYVIDVRVTDVPSPPADGSSLAYTLVDVISETPAQ